MKIKKVLNEATIEQAAKEYGMPLQYVVETKIDGLSSALEYKNGVFIKTYNLVP